MRDPSRFEDFADVDYLSLTFHYGDDDRLEVTFGSGTARVRWTGVVAADKARRFRHVWEALPSDRVKPSRWLYYLRNTLAAAAVITWVLNLAQFFLSIGFWWIGILSIVFIIGCFLVVRHITRRVQARPAQDQPFVLERPRSASQWSDEKHRTAVIVGIGGIVATVLVGVATVVVTIMAAKG